MWDVINRRNIMFEIRKGVPLPVQRTNNSYNFSALEVGDSIFIPDAVYSSSKPFWAAQKYSSRAGKKIVSKKEGSGIRIWRVI